MAHVQQYKRKRRVAVPNGLRQVFIHQPSKKRILPASVAQLNQGCIADRAKAAAHSHAHIAGQLQAGQPGPQLFKEGIHIFKHLGVRLVPPASLRLAQGRKKAFNTPEIKNVAPQASIM